MRRWGIAAILAAAVVGLVGCGGSSDNRDEAFLRELDATGVPYDREVVIDAAKEMCREFERLGDVELAGFSAFTKYPDIFDFDGPTFKKAAWDVYCPTLKHTPSPLLSEEPEYVDPLAGADEGYPPTSGEEQRRYGCEQGYIPPEEC